MTFQKRYKNIPPFFILTFILLSAGILISGHLYYENQKEYIKKEKQQDLAAIADLKVGQIANWRRERLGDARIILGDRLIIPFIREYLKKPSETSKKEILDWLKGFLQYASYKNIILLDADGKIRLGVVDGKEVIGSDAKILAEKATRTKDVVFSDLYPSKTAGIIRLTLAVPLLASKGTETFPVGAILLRVDPYQFLYPLIQTWPTPSETAETILVRREGDKVVFLNELRHKKNTALNLRFPVSEEKLPAAIVVRGISGVVEGNDYRGVPVIAAIRPIPDSPWFLVSKVDAEEIYAPVRERLRVVTIVVVLLIAGSGVGIGLIWRNQSAEFYRELNEKLEQRIQERTAQLEAANKELEAFSYSVSHDLRAPLRAINGFSEALLEDYYEKLDNEGKDYLRRVSAASQQMAQLIDDLLNLSRVTRYEMRTEKVNLSELAKKIAGELQATEPGRQAELIITDGLVVNGDMHLLRIMLRNLLENAFKFTGKQNYTKIEFGVIQLDSERAFFVRDNGAGFDMAYGDKLYGAFHRLHTQGEFQGTGIGLAIVKRIVQRHGGHVWAEGKVGKGATFYFTLP
jgi:signal transduction histidine kinase